MFDLVCPCATTNGRSHRSKLLSFFQSLRLIFLESAGNSVTCEEIFGCIYRSSNFLSFRYSLQMDFTSSNENEAAAKIAKIKPR